MFAEPLIRHTGVHYDITDFMAELEQNSHYWDIYTSRQKNIEFHKETKCIPLMMWHPKPGQLQRDCLITTERDFFSRDFPVTYTFLKQFSEQANSILQNAAYVFLPASKSVYPHIDEGDFYAANDRYHFVLTGTYNLIVEDQQEILTPGGVYWFDNTKMHSVDNFTHSDRIALIFDMKKNKTPKVSDSMKFF